MALLKLRGARRALCQFVAEPLDFAARVREFSARLIDFAAQSVALARRLLEVMSDVRVQGYEQVRPGPGLRQLLLRRRAGVLVGRHVVAPRQAGKSRPQRRRRTFHPFEADALSIAKIVAGHGVMSAARRVDSDGRLG